MQRLLNKAEKERSEMMKKIERTVPVNYDAYLYSYHWENKISIIIIIISNCKYFIKKG